jgi:hypothetical protein
MKWINVTSDERGLWTADLMENQTVVDNIGGHYPKSQQATLDAFLKWGRDKDVRLNAKVESPVLTTTVEVNIDPDFDELAIVDYFRWG